MVSSPARYIEGLLTIFYISLSSFDEGGVGKATF